MNKVEFLEKLRETLSGQVPVSVVHENLKYYDAYIKGEVKSGKRESVVISEIGDPRLIAKSIIDATPGAEYGGHEPYTERTEKKDFKSGKSHVYDLSKWYWKLLGVILLIGILTLVFMVVTGILSLLVSLFPVIGLVVFVIWVLKKIQ